MEERNLNSWEEFKETLKDIRKEHDTADQWRSSPLLFRGQENACWLLQTTLDRKRERMLFTDYYRILSTIRPQVETLTTSEWPIPSYPEVKKRVHGLHSYCLQPVVAVCSSKVHLAIRLGE